MVKANNKIEGQCPHCYAELIFEEKDIKDGFTTCPNCSNEFSIKASPIQRSNNKSFGLKWFVFYTYIRLPISILLLIISVAILYDRVFMAVDLNEIFSLLLLLIYLVLLIALLIGLKDRKLWAWKLNFIVLIIETIIAAIGKSDDIVIFITLTVLGSLLWILPNWVYFSKRKFLFF